MSRDAEAWAMLSGLFEAARIIPPVQRAAPGTLPLTVISGFLGTGKTTLLNHLLHEPHGRRLAVLVNDFGRLEIDAALIRSRQADTIALTNGCACCTISGDLTRTLVVLAQQDDPPDAVVLEASGLADPHGIAQIALANPALRLEGILTLLDAETALDQAQDPACGETILAQLTAADLVVLNKTDLAPNTRPVREWLHDAAPARPVIETTNARLPIDIALGLQSPRRSAFPPAATHTAPFQTWSLETTAPLHRPRLQALLDALPPTVLRAKGLLCLSDEPTTRTLYQRTGRRWSFTPSGLWETPPHSSLVLIGTADAIDPQAVQATWEACALSPGWDKRRRPVQTMTAREG